MPITFGKGNGGSAELPPPDMADHVISIAKDFVEQFGPTGDLTPHMFVPFKDPTRGWGIVAVPVIGSKEKMALISRTALRQLPTPWYVYVMEAWVGTRVSPTGKISDLPMDDREEWILVVLVENHKGMSKTETCQVKRFKGQRTLTPWEKKGEYTPTSGLWPMDW